MTPGELAHPEYDYHDANGRPLIGPCHVPGCSGMSLPGGGDAHSASPEGEAGHRRLTAADWPREEWVPEWVRNPMAPLSLDGFVEMEAANVYTVTVHHRATAYTIRAIPEAGGYTTYLIAGRFANAGEWITLGDDSAAEGIAYSYLAEKMPELARHAGDREGWIMAFRKLGVRVF